AGNMKQDKRIADRQNKKSEKQ
ncbi:DNA helicase UvrB, partial [Enterococcus faecalis]|nr:DNA helicase UvrB [Enterococcus faecalis]